MIVYPLTPALLLLAEAARKFRFYEAQHRAKDTAESLAKAEVNAEIAGRIEVFVRSTASSEVAAHRARQVAQDASAEAPEDPLSAMMKRAMIDGAAEEAQLDELIHDAPPRPGEIRMIDGKQCRFIERELEGDKWEILGHVVRK